MKFTPEVQAALQTLKDNAESDFERHRIAVLEKDLTEPPKVEIIDDTHQKFDGVIYYKDKHGHFNKGISIHRAVWRYYNGEIPMGDYDIHHIDFNKANNQPENLQLLSRAEHSQKHSILPSEKTCPQCGKTFIPRKSKQKFCCHNCFAESHINPELNKCCAYCGEPFKADEKRRKYCSHACAARANRKSKNVEKICLVCGKKFTVPYRKRKQICCSQLCANKRIAESNKRLVEKICPACGKKFIRVPSSKQVCCSHSCGTKLWRQKQKASTTTSPDATTSPLNHSAD